ncbi:MAG TPA: glycosyltransferase family 2 protein [Pyrinomonadaceae bacterium]|nr:glycosyltransferase family 2 protein [Pyrinomonadaceae bacterium]
MTEIARSDFVSVLMPLYCEGNHVREVLLQVREALATANVSYEIILVDDGSPDNTWTVISEEARSSSMIRAVRLSRNFGKESAICAGLEVVRGQAVIVMDGDGQHPPSLLPKMISLWRETGADIVEGTKVMRGKESLLDKLSAGLFYLIWNKLSGFELRGASDFKLMNRRSVEALLQMDERNVFFRGMTAWLGFHRVEIPFEVATRAGGRSGWSFLRRLRLALTGISAFSTLPLQLITFAGVLFLLFAIALGVQTLVVFLRGRAFSGFTTVIFLLLLIGSCLMISLGIVGEYLARIYEEVKRRPRYLITQSVESAASQQKRFQHEDDRGAILLRKTQTS